MRIILFISFFLFQSLAAQLPANYCKQVWDIAKMERRGHERILQTPSGMAAPTNIDISYYRCEWEVDPAIRYIKGKVTVYFVMIKAGSQVSLDLMNTMITDSVKQRNANLTFQHLSNVLQINLSATLPAGSLDSISIFYKGPPANTGFGSFIQSTHAGIPVIWTLSEPYGSRDWWPCKNGLDDKADSVDIIVTCPAAYRSAANGLLQNETLVEGGTKRVCSWKHRYPIASYLVCFSTTDFSVFNNTVQLGNITIPMQTWCYPESLISFMSGTQNTLDAIRLYHNYFGDYPFIREKYGHVQFGWGGGMEHQTSTFVVVIDEGLCAHELGHQWFGDKITCGSWEDIWLNEGFATHMASFYMENKYPATAITNRKAEINSITSIAGGSVKVDDTINVNRIFDGRLSYQKGSHLLYMLRWIMGDSLFFKGLRQYQNDPKIRYGFARTSDLQRNLEQAGGLNLGYFFKQWFEGQGYPTYTIQWTQVGSHIVKVKILQTTSHSSVSFFQLPLPLKFKNATQEKTIVLDNKIPGEEFIKNIGFIADTVFIDPDYWLISRNNTSIKMADNASGQNLVEVFPNPVRIQFTIYLRKFSSPNADITLFNVSGQRVLAISVTLYNGSEYLEIPTARLAAGEYSLQIKGRDGFIYTRKLMR